jgi:hypothetical protein
MSAGLAAHVPGSMTRSAMLLAAVSRTALPMAASCYRTKTLRQSAERIDCAQGSDATSTPRPPMALTVPSPP